ncbi:M23 family metallopeptidase [Agromyces sp. SYSU T00194]|uniref:M23 family metallopeptidase n=1 Tax=Agromyces chitinivorans TaxID=3158560 RepID=UPI0033909923
MPRTPSGRRAAPRRRAVGPRRGRSTQRTPRLPDALRRALRDASVAWNAWGARPSRSLTLEEYRARKARLRTVTSGFGFLFVGALAVSTTLPAAALTSSDDQAYAASVYDQAPAEDPQTIVVGASEIAPIESGSYDVEAAPPPLYTSVAGVGVTALADVDTVVWPFPNHSKISDGFGYRVAPCAGCSTFHDGIDFNPGAGTAIGSIADGVVVTATAGGGGLGNYVEVQHNIGGRLVTSLYAHMQAGSISVSVGQHVTAGQTIGRVGSTGQSTGPHLHLEMYYTDGSRFDGYAWLASHVNG